MRAIDTNVAARFLLHDDPVQSSIAAGVIADGVLIPHTVILELGWLLLSRYRQPRSIVADALSDLIDIPSVEIADPVLVRWAIARFADGGDLADMFHIVGSRDADSFASFEKRLGSLAGPDAPVPIEKLG